MNKFPRILPLTLTAVFLLAPGIFARPVVAEQISLSTYIPAPYGAYDQVRLLGTDMNSIDCDYTLEGLLVFDESSRALRLCRDSSWQGFKGVWVQEADNLYPDATLSSPDLNIGIGTTNPQAKLHVFDDAGGRGEILIFPGSLVSDPETRLKSGAGGIFKFVNSGTNPGLPDGLRTTFGYHDGTDLHQSLNILHETKQYSIGDAYPDSAYDFLVSNGGDLRLKGVDDNSTHIAFQTSGVTEYRLSLVREWQNETRAPHSLHLAKFGGRYRVPFVAASSDHTSGSGHRYPRSRFDAVGRYGYLGFRTIHQTSVADRAMPALALRSWADPAAPSPNPFLTIYEQENYGGASVSRSGAFSIGSFNRHTEYKSLMVEPHSSSSYLICDQAGPVSECVVLDPGHGMPSFPSAWDNTVMYGNPSETCRRQAGDVNITCSCGGASQPACPASPPAPNPYIGLGTSIAFGQEDEYDHTDYGVSPYENNRVKTFADVGALRDSGSGPDSEGQRQGAIVFRPYNNGSPVEVMRIKPEGNVGIGTSAPSFTLHVNGSAAKTGSSSWVVPSDRRLKKNITGIEDALGILLGLKGASFEWKEPENFGHQHGTRMGFIAQDVEQVIPQWVDEDTDGYKMVNTKGFEALAVEAVRQLDEQITVFAEEAARLEQDIRDLLEHNEAALNQIQEEPSP